MPKKKPSALGDTYLSFFIWNEKVYPVGCTVFTSKNFDPRYKIERIILD